MPDMIERLYAYVAEDADGNEGIVSIPEQVMIGDDGIPIVTGWLPAVGADVERMASLRMMIEQIAQNSHRPVQLVEFSGRRLVDIIDP